ncbi:unnamed protein product [Rotaria sp. Silwood1]|nr:unnamed protein product [Rotaria sp. Silwood1]
MSIILSSKNKDQLLFEGFRYRRDRSVWQCIKDKYKGRARFDENIYEAYKNHTCQAPNPEEIEKAVYNYEIRKKAENSHDPPRLIIQEARLKLSSDAAADNDIPKEPTSFSEIVIPLKFQLTISNQQFLLYDNDDNQNRLLIFASRDQLDLLNGCEVWHCDGTFAVVPKLFEQTYSIHGLIREKTLPLIYSLLPNKKEETYETLFRVVQQHVQRVPRYITIDFEKGAENAFAIVYPQMFFLRFLRELGLKKEFLENNISRRTMKNLVALAFVPEQDVIRKFTEIKESANEILDEYRW